VRSMFFVCARLMTSVHAHSLEGTFDANTVFLANRFSVVGNWFQLVFVLLAFIEL